MPVTPEQVKECFEYSFALIEQSFSVAGVDVEIWHDDYTQNPYDDCDGMAPAIWYYDSFREYGEYDLESPLEGLNVSRHWRAICDALGICPTEHDKAARLTKRDYPRDDMAEIRRELFQDALADMRGNSWGRACDYLDALAALWRLRGVQADTFQSNGYSPGDSSRGLIVHHPEWLKAMGMTPGKYDVEKDMQCDVKTYGAWAWGDVYGFTVDDDSCGGVYGFDIDYMADMVADSVNSVLNRRAACAESSRPDMYMGV